ncbi:MAG: PAS domain S-box protein [Desulfomonile tiedjei]|uniref:histidine kinase n=1 Tax=Desulfomonile tiedjei TaxID=2358 RepID=A0A9D6Z398_9BACT|nr:PAS domain S-box protein [Desulfomonile tiedjei]
MKDNDFHDYSVEEDEHTESIDLNRLLTTGVTRSGSFDVESGILGSTFDKLAQTLPIPSMLIDHQFNVVLANQACGRISAAYKKIVALPFRNLFPDESTARRFQDRLEAVFANRKTQTCEGILQIEDGKIWGRMTFRAVRMMENRFVFVLIEDLSTEKRQLVLNRKISDQLEREISRRKQAERELSESERKYRQVVETANDIIYMTDNRGFFTFVNPMGLRISGYSEGEIIGRHYMDLVPSEYAKKVGRFYAMQALRRLPVTYQEFPILKKQGGMLWLGQNVQLMAEDDAVNGFLAIARDITDRKTAEEALRESEQRYKDLFENAHDLIYTHDNRGNYTSANAAALTILGYTPAEVVNLNFRDIVDPSYLAITEENFRKKIEDGVESTGPYETLVRSKSGKLRWLEVTSRIIRSQGKPVAVHGIARDVTDRKIARDHLRQSEERFRVVAEQTGQLVYDYDVSTGQIEWSGAIQQNTGFSPEEFQNVDAVAWKELIHPEDRSRALELLECALLDGSKYHVDYRLKRKDGTYLWMENNGVFQRDESGRIHRMLGAQKNITDRKMAEDALDIEKRRFQILSDNAPFGLLVIGSDGVFRYINPKFEELFGYRLEDVPNGREWFRKAYPDPLCRHEVISDWIEDLKGSIAGEQRPRTFTVRCKDGTDKIIGFQTVQLITGEHLMTCEDISYRKKGEEALKERERFLSSVFECIQDGLSILDKKLNIIRVNPTIERMFPHGAPYIGRKCHEVYQLSSQTCDSCPSLRTIGTGQSSHAVVPRRGPEGEMTGWLDVYSFPLVVESTGELQGVIEYIRDVTEQKRLEEQLGQAAKMEAIGTLAGGLAHDFNNLLQIVLGYADLLLLGKDRVGQDYHRVAAIRAAAKRGSNLVQRILTFSRRVETNLRPVNLNSELKQIEDLLQSTIPKMIEIELRLTDNLRSANADPTQIEQILLNLAVNAKHAMPEGGKLILETRNVTLDEKYCSTCLETRPGDYVMLVVSDTGHGMDKNILDRIFEPFFTTKNQGEGTGLGLSMVFGIVKGHGGHITCYSEPGMGTSFHIYFPAIETQAQFDPETTMTMPAFGNEILLLVDDEESIRNLGRELLCEVGYEVITAATAREALEIYREHKDQISLIILDLVMPDMGGRQCLQELLAINPKAKVIVASGYSSEGPAREVLESGAKEFLSKPYNFKEILRAVRSALDKD